MKRNLLILTMGVIIFIVALLLFVFQVRQSQVVVVTRLGNPVREITEPGPHWKLPWPIELIHPFDQRVQNFEDKFTEALTQDSFNLLTSVYVGWKITNSMAFYPKFAGSSEPIAYAEQVLDRMLSNAKTAVIGKHPLSDFLAPDGEGNKFLAIEKEILDVIQAQVNNPNNNYGLEIEFLGIKKLGLPENVTQQVFERMQSERKVLADRLQFEGEAEAQKIRSEADRKAAEMLANAEGQAIEIRGKGEADAAQYLKAFQQNPELANFIFSLTALENSLKDRSTLIFDQHTPPFNLLSGVSTNLLKK